MSYEKKYDLIRQDPVTCVRYFEHRLKCLWGILSAPCGPFREYELEHKYDRTEFQARGSPHIYALLWLKDAPKYDGDKPESIERCTEFIDKLISVSSKQVTFVDPTHLTLDCVRQKYLYSIIIAKQTTHQQFRLQSSAPKVPRSCECK